jgi:2'-5' RNA ligase
MIRRWPPSPIAASSWSMAASPPASVRLFIGIFVPPELHGPLLADRQAIPEAWRWTRPEQLHLTLRFLGDVPTDAVPDLAATLQPLGHHAPLPLTIEGWQGFPGRRSANVLIREVSTTPALLDLWQETAAAVEPWMAKPEKKSFRAHITLGRSRRGLPVPPVEVEPLDWLATHVHLIESRLSPIGSSYEIRATVALGGDPWSRRGSATPS